MIVRGNLAAVLYENKTPNGVVEVSEWIRVGGDVIKEIRAFYDSSKIREILSPAEQESLDGSEA